MFQLRKIRITSVRRHWMSPKLTRKNYTFDASLRKDGSQKNERDFQAICWKYWPLKRIGKLDLTILLSLCLVGENFGYHTMLYKSAKMCNFVKPNCWSHQRPNLPACLTDPL